MRRGGRSMRAGIACVLIGAALLATVPAGGTIEGAGKDRGRGPRSVVFVTQNAAESRVIDVIDDRFKVMQVRNRGHVPQVAEKRVEGVVVTGEDLGSPQIQELVRREFGRDNTVAVLDAGQAEADALNALVGRIYPTVLDERVALLGLREDHSSIASQSRTHLLQYRAEGPEVGDPEAADDTEGDFLEVAFQDSAESGFGVPDVGDDPDSELTSLAHSWPSTMIKTDASGDALQININTWAMRSFDAASVDYYYVQQEVLNTIKSTGGNTALSAGTKIVNKMVTNPAPRIVDASPGTSQSETTITSGVSYGVGGNAGFNQSQGGILSVAPQLSVNNSTTRTVSPTTVTNSADAATGNTIWDYLTVCSNSTLCPVNDTTPIYANRFIWEVPFSAYEQDQTSITYSTDASTIYGTVPYSTPGLEFKLNTTLPLPFNAPELGPPTVDGVDRSTAAPGDTINITGTNFYLFDSVAIGGNDATDYHVTESDTAMTIVIPSDQPIGRNQSILVITDEGISPEGVTIQIERS